MQQYGVHYAVLARAMCWSKSVSAPFWAANAWRHSHAHRFSGRLPQSVRGVTIATVRGGGAHRPFAQLLTSMVNNHPGYPCAERMQSSTPWSFMTNQPRISFKRACKIYAEQNLGDFPDNFNNFIKIYGSIQSQVRDLSPKKVKEKRIL